MIRVRLLSDTDTNGTNRWEGGETVPYEESLFYDLLREKGDFADAESLALLRHLHGEDAVTGKWYRRTTPEGRPCLPAISPEAKYGLVVIENSRKGLYTDLAVAFTDDKMQERIDDTYTGENENPTV